MNKKHFYHHLVKIEILDRELDSLFLSEHEKKELLVFFDKALHHQVLDLVLTHLPTSHKKVFLTLVMEEKHIEIWELIEKHAPHVPELIIESSQVILLDFLADINEIKRKK